MSQSNNMTHNEHQKHSSTKEKQSDHPSHNKDTDDYAKQQAQRDKALKDSFPASDPPPTE